MRASEKQRLLKKKKIQAIVRKETCQHLKRTAMYPDPKPGHLKCIDCGAIINSLGQGIFGQPLSGEKRKRERMKIGDG